MNSRAHTVRVSSIFSRLAPLLIGLAAIGLLFLAACAYSQDPNQPPPGSPPGTPTAGATATAEGQAAIDANIQKIASVRAKAASEGRPLTAQEQAYIDALEQDNRDIRGASADLAAAPTGDAPDPTDPLLVGITTLGGLLPPPFNALIAGFVPPAILAWRNWGGRKALVALVKAIKKTKERVPEFAEALSENKSEFNITLGTAKPLIDKVRSQVGDDPNAPPVVIPKPATPARITT